MRGQSSTYSLVMKGEECIAGETRPNDRDAIKIRREFNIF